MSIFLTGATGYIGSYIAEGILRNHPDRLALLVRAKSVEDARRRLWNSMQLHMDFPEFQALVDSRVDFFLGDLTSRRFGLDDAAWRKLVDTTGSIIHCAASLNRKSAKMCLNVNLRGTLEVIQLARAARDRNGLRRFSEVSTVAVAGHRSHECVAEDDMIDWDRSDYDPYARTKKFGEHMLHELLPDVDHTVFRPSTVLGDSRFPQTIQFDMVRAFVFLANLPVVPVDARWRMDIVPANWVAESIVHVHQTEKPKHTSYNLSAGNRSEAYGTIIDALRRDGWERHPRFAPWLARGFTGGVGALADTPKEWGLSRGASLLKVFMPYITFDTVFDNAHIIEERGVIPRPFSEYAYGLLRFAHDGGFTYPHRPWPGDTKSAGAA